MLLEFNALVDKKLNGDRWSLGDIDTLVQLVSSGRLSGPQIGAVLMLIFIKGMDFEETAHLTSAMTRSGASLAWPKEIRHLVVDKHSTGGVGDSVSLPMVPSLVALGVKVPMISGRSLGHTGGTIDKIESVPGFNAGLTAEEMQQAVAKVGAFIAGQTGDMVPADRVLYATRSETATVRSIPLITSSILSKKAAESLSALVMDVKFGRAAFMTSFEDAKKLAESIEKTGRGYGMKVTVFLTDMDRPLGRCVGNGVEVAEALQILNDGGSAGLRELVAQQGGCLLRHAGVCATTNKGAALMKQSWKDGTALRAMRDILVNQGVNDTIASDLCEPGDFGVAEYLRRMQRPPGDVTQLTCLADGFVSDIDALAVAEACHLLSRPTCLGGALDYAAGLELLVVKGDAVKQGQPWVTVYHREPLTDKVTQALCRSLVLASEVPANSPLIREVFPAE